MSVNFFGKDNTPINKQIMALDATTTTTIWTPVSGKKIVLTDLSISAANIGTVRIYQLPDGDLTSTPTLVWENFVSSAVITQHFETPKINPKNDGILRVVSGANGEIFINMGGFEI